MVDARMHVLYWHEIFSLICQEVEFLYARQVGIIVDAFDIVKSITHVAAEAKKNQRVMCKQWLEMVWEIFQLHKIWNDSRTSAERSLRSANQVV